MQCPKCKSELIKGEPKVYETILEHVSDPNNENLPKRATWECPTSCVKGFWNRYGDYYGPDFKTSETHSAYNSPALKDEIEAYGTGLKRERLLNPSWTFGYWQPMISYSYQSNNKGEVLKRFSKLRFLKKDTGSKDYVLLVTLWSQTWAYLWRINVKRGLRRKKLNLIFKKSRNRDFPHRAFETFVKVRFLRSYLKYNKSTKNEN